MKALLLLVLACACAPAAFSARPAAPVISVHSGEIKQLDFAWQPIADVTHYQLWFKPSDSSGWVKYAEKPAPRTSLAITVSVHLLEWPQARYQLKACNASGCSTSNTVKVSSEKLVAMGYLKPDTPANVTYYGVMLALSADGNTLAVQSGELIDGNPQSVVIYVYRRTSAGWRRDARLVPSTPSGATQLGDPIALSGDGNLLAYGAQYENAYGEGYCEVGAVYLFRRSGSAWTEAQKIPGSTCLDNFGDSVKLDDAGRTLAVTHYVAGEFRYENGTVEVYRSSSAAGPFVHDRTLNVPLQEDGQPNTCSSIALSGNGSSLFRRCYDRAVRRAYIQVLQSPGFGESSRVDILDEARGPDVSYDGTRLIVGLYGAANVYELGPGGWGYGTHLSSFGAEDYGGPRKVAISRDGKIAAIGVPGDIAAGLGPIFPPYQTADDSSGGVVIHERKSTGWVLRRLVKPGSTQNQWAGFMLALGDNGRVLALGAPRESSGATGIDGDRNDETAPTSGAVWLY
jgi:trimeric autotransporter adhesin